MTRCVPWVIHNYHLEELISGKEMRKNIAVLFRQHADVKSPQVIDLLIYKGRGELEVRCLCKGGDLGEVRPRRQLCTQSAGALSATQASLP